MMPTSHMEMPKQNNTYESLSVPGEEATHLIYVHMET